MDKKYKKHLCWLIGSQVAVCSLIILSAFFWTRSVSVHTRNVLEQEAFRMVEDKLRGRVSHIISHINEKRENIRKELASLAEFMCISMSTAEDSPLDTAIRMSSSLRSTQYGHSLRIAMYDTQKHTVNVFDAALNEFVPTNLFSPDNIHRHILSCPAYSFLAHESFELYIFAEQKDIDNSVKKYIHKVIHSSHNYGDDGYVWVNEIVNFKGGRDYAIRVIHSRFIDTEGTYLHTDTQDTQGNLPYLTELEGIKKSGEVFHTYYFKNKNDGEITENASYASLYRPFNWIIATGEPLEDVLAYAVELNTYNDGLLRATLVNALLGMLLIFAIDIAIIVFVNIRYRRSISTFIKTETKLDALTGAYSRKAAEEILGIAFSNFKDNAKNSLLMMMDIDDFKKVNDTHGHDVGDLVLKKVSQEILKNIRNSDYLLRWGGEEFVLLCTGMSETAHQRVAQEILWKVRALSLETEHGPVKVTISIGSSFFHAEDKSYEQALKRADMTMYYCKKSGKNQYANWEELPGEVQEMAISA
ncbi:MAG: sensor domain-containing diguanylate cyclase [Desulfovibrionaceae bacterium]|nr:sensor domain-containing diguanylate cyclase [Desulfovibrionaceae bacterium]